VRHTYVHAAMNAWRCGGSRHAEAISVSAHGLQSRQTFAFVIESLRMYFPFVHRVVDWDDGRRNRNVVA
jgi:hypothetical protein